MNMHIDCTEARGPAALQEARYSLPRTFAWTVLLAIGLASCNQTEEDIKKGEARRALREFIQLATLPAWNEAQQRALEAEYAIDTFLKTRSTTSGDIEGAHGTVADRNSWHKLLWGEEFSYACEDRMLPAHPFSRIAFDGRMVPVKDGVIQHRFNMLIFGARGTRFAQDVDVALARDTSGQWQIKEFRLAERRRSSIWDRLARILIMAFCCSLFARVLIRSFAKDFFQGAPNERQVRVLYVVTVVASLLLHVFFVYPLAWFYWKESVVAVMIAVIPMCIRVVLASLIASSSVAGFTTRQVLRDLFEQMSR